MLFALALAATVHAESLDDGSVTAKLIELAETSGEAVLVGGNNSLAIAFAREIADKNPDITIRVERHQSTDELTRALAAEGMRCGALLEDVDDGWSVRPVGDCSASGGNTDWMPEPEDSEPPSGLAEPSSTTPSKPEATAERTPKKERAPAEEQRAPEERDTSSSATAPTVPTALTADDLAKITARQRRYTETLLEAPDPGAAISMSLVLGFGAGHYYAKKPERGNLHAGVQVGGLLLAGLGQVMLSTATTQQDISRASLITQVGTLTFSVDRLIDIGLAPKSAHDTRREMLSGGR